MSTGRGIRNATGKVSDPWAPRAYDRWMRRLKRPLELEAGRDDWIMESFERIGRPEYAATVRALLNSGDA